MKQVTLVVPDNKYQFLLELINNLGFEKIEELNIPEEHKLVVAERIKKSKPEELIPWQDARKQLRFKSK